MPGALLYVIIKFAVRDAKAVPPPIVAQPSLPWRDVAKQTAVQS